MANITQKESGSYGIQYRYGGTRHHRSLGKIDDKQAREIKSIVERRLRMLKLGDTTLPDDSGPDQLWNYLRFGSTIDDRSAIRVSERLDIMCERFLASLEIDSRKLLRTHCNHMRRILKGHRKIDSIKADDLLAYIAARKNEKGRRGFVKGDTICKELLTFKQLWDFAHDRNLVAGDNPYHQVALPKRSEPIPFMTWEEIESAVSHGGLTDFEIAELWDALFLREEQIAEFLEHVRVESQKRKYPFIYPALCFCAYTGSRRSEMFRARRADLLDTGKIQLREKKKAHDKTFTFRFVPLHPELTPILGEYISRRTVGQEIFVKENGQPLEDRTARDAFDAVTAGSKWERLKGYHVLRHSFASNLARHGVDDRIIRALMGHKTEEMSRRYRHLFPEDQADAVKTISLLPKASQ
ncbi:tyrosine-type recombinase/integrase [Rubinisphaera sp. JC750]|uniref:tyrosine-type recombinase/integrase n=1 Tax=Rubinisphaera sp. JC750 TaxID=2898658 RepID=UPI001F292540|nr:tyrosine-type recombinase/integrase [Rubinisphaera sp. JC750]